MSSYSPKQGGFGSSWNPTTAQQQYAYEVPQPYFDGNDAAYYDDGAAAGTYETYAPEQGNWGGEQVTDAYSQQQHWNAAQYGTGLEQPMASMSMQQQQQHQPYVPPAVAGPTGSVLPDGVVPADPRHMSLTVNSFPANAALFRSANMPFAVTIQPLADISDTIEELPLVNFADFDGVVRCKACRTYVGPFAGFIDHGKRWRCNICARPNDVPPKYFSQLDTQGLRVDRFERPELCNSTYEILAPAEYMVRPPQPPVFIFAIDVSSRAVKSGMLHSVCDSLRSVLDSLPGGKRTQVALITYDSTIHMYSLRSGMARPHMVVITELENVFLPFPEDFLVNLYESRALIEVLIDSLPTMHASNSNVETAFGPALQAAYLVGAMLGGRIFMFCSGLPSLGPARLKNRSDPKLSGSEKEHTLLKAATSFYTSWGIRCSKSQLSVDAFLFPDQYCDVATISDMCRYAGGQLHYYPGFSVISPHYESFPNDFFNTVVCEQAWEAVMRVRVSKAAVISTYHGNFYLRGADLMTLPVTEPSKAFVLELKAADGDAAAGERLLTLQAALLYTASSGERRIRVINTAIPLANNLAELFISANSANIINCWTKQALNETLSHGFHRARETIQANCTSLIRGLRSSGAGFTRLDSEADYPESLWQLPTLVLGMFKSVAFRSSNDVDIDTRAAAIANLRWMGVADVEQYFRPVLIALHDMNGDLGLVDSASGAVFMPNALELTMTSISSEGLYLADNGMTMVLWVGLRANPDVLMSCFGIQSVEIRSQLILQLPLDGDAISPCYRVHNVLYTLRQSRLTYQPLFVVVEGDSREVMLRDMLVRDRTDSVMGTDEFLRHLSQTTM